MGNEKNFIGELPAGAPAEFLVFPYGRISTKDRGEFFVGEEEQKAIVAAFQANGHDMVIDYEHQTLGGKYAAPDGRAPAAGWIKGLVAKGKDGLWAVAEWTDKAREYMARREYRFFSPVITYSKKSKRAEKLFSLALTNAPAMNSLMPLVAKEGHCRAELDPEAVKVLRAFGRTPADLSDEEFMEIYKASAKQEKRDMELKAMRDSGLRPSLHPDAVEVFRAFGRDPATLSDDELWELCEGGAASIEK